MNPKTKFWLVLLGFVLVMGIIACSCGSILPTPGAQTAPSVPTKRPSGAEPMPGLAGKWHYQGQGSIGFYCRIVWTGETYKVPECVDDDASITFELKGEDWDGVSLTWTFYIPETGYTTTYETQSLSGDSLTVKRTGTGGIGTTVLTRLP
jgi:hypothetical protein